MNNAVKMRVMKVIKKNSFSEYFVSVAQTQKNCFPYVNLYVMTITTSGQHLTLPPRLKA